MLSRFICLLRQAKAVVSRRARAAARRLARRLRAGWSAHLNRLSNNGPYAAAVAARALGLVPPATA